MRRGVVATVLAVLACQGCHCFSLHALSAAGRGAPWAWRAPGGGGGGLPAGRARARSGDLVAAHALPPPSSRACDAPVGAMTLYGSIRGLSRGQELAAVRVSHAYTYTYTHTHTHTHMYVHIFTHIHTRVCVCVYVCENKCVCVRARTS